MKPPFLALVLTVSIGLALGCTPSPSAVGLHGDVLLDPPLPPEGRPLRQALGPNGHHVIFLNFDGVKLAAGYDDAMRDRSSIAASLGRTVTVPPFDSTLFDRNRARDLVIADLLALVRGYFRAYNVDVVAERPASPDYVMCAIGGLPDIIGRPCQVFQGGASCVGGLAPLDCRRSNAGISYNPQGDVEVVFAFSDTAKHFGQSYQGKLTNLAVTVAQETAHAYGLGHSNNPQDIMYPQTTGKTTGFLTGAYADANNCANGVGSQDADGLLKRILGVAEQPMGDTQPPQVGISAPVDGATLPPTFTVTVDAQDNVGVASVRVTATGAGSPVLRSFAAPPYQVSLTLVEGSWTLTAQAVDAAGNAAQATAEVTVKGGHVPLPFGSPCSLGTQCQSGLCAGGICNQSCGACPAAYQCNAQRVCERTKGGGPGPMAMAGEIGAACMLPTDCRSNLCADLAGQNFCTGPCDPTDPSSCPEGLVCTDFGAEGTLCAFPYQSGGGSSSCSVGPAPGRGSNAGPPLLLSLVAALLGLSLGRRRR